MRFRAAFWAGAAVVLAVNAAALVGVLVNRSGGKEAVLELEERELQLLEAEQENSGRALVWILGDGRGNALYKEQEWLDSARLAALGFDTTVDPADPAAERHYRSQPARGVFVALELEGVAFERALARRIETLEAELAELREKGGSAQEIETLERLIRVAPEQASRLFIVDADRDADAIRARHPDRDSVAILRGVVRVRAVASGVEPARLEGRVVEIFPPTLSIPPRWLPVVRDLAEMPLAGRGASDGLTIFDEPPRFRVRVAFGRSYEPWIESIEPITR